MIFFTLTSSGLKEAIGLAAHEKDAVWCSADAISEDDFKIHKGVSLTRFSGSFLNAQPADIADAIATIEEHHPDQRIWLEANGLSKHKNA